MQLEITETNAAVAPRASFLPMRWGAIFAGLAVGLASNLLLMLLGTAAGLSLFEIGENNDSRTFQIAASAWNSVSMVIAAFIGGYVAARGSGLKRTSDGLLHAAAAWGMTLLIAVFMASTASNATFETMFPSLQGGSLSDSARIIGNAGQGDRQAAAEALQENLGISGGQAEHLIDQALALSGREEEIAPSNRNAAQETVRTAAIISIWLALSTLFSLAAALGGGVRGVHGARRALHKRTTTLS